MAHKVYRLNLTARVVIDDETVFARLHEIMVRADEAGEYGADVCLSRGELAEVLDHVGLEMLQSDGPATMLHLPYYEED